MGLALAGVSLPIFFTGLIALELFSYRWPIFPNVTFVPFTQNPLLWARNLVLPWISPGLPLRGAVRAADPGGHAGDDERGLHPDGAREGTAGADRDRQARAPRRADPDHHDLRDGPRPAARRRHPHRGTRSPCTASACSRSRPIQNQDFPEIMGVVILTAFFVVIANLFVDILYAIVDPGEALVATDGGRRYDGDPVPGATEPVRRFAEAPCPPRRRRPAAGGGAPPPAARDVEGMKPPTPGACWRCGICGCTSRPTTAWSRRWTGSRSAWSGAGRWASSANPGPARASPAWHHGHCITAATRSSSGKIYLDGEDLVAADPDRVRGCGAARWR